MKCDAPGGPLCRYCQQPLAAGEERECPIGERPPQLLSPAEASQLLPGLDDPTLIGNCLEAAIKALGIPPCPGCQERRDWLNKAHAYVREQFGFASPEPFALTDVTVCLSSFLRFDCLRRCLSAIRFHYPELPIIVADQSGEQATGEDYEFCRAFPGVTWIEMPFDAGISAARNAAVAAAKTRLICLIDDDHLVSDESPLEALIGVLNHDSEIGLVCGCIRQTNAPGNSENACGWFADYSEKSGGILHADLPQRPLLQTADGVWYRRIDRFLNCFVAKRSVLTGNPWRVEHKIAGEHLDHTIRLWKAGVGCAYSPNVVFGELPGTSRGYAAFRKRNSQPLVREHWGIESQTGVWCTRQESGIARRKSQPPAAEPPCIVLLTPGHTGSTICAGLLSLLGWHLPDNDPEFNEPLAIRELNDRLGSQPTLDFRHLASAALASLPRPWILKDPRFCGTLEKWLPALAKYQPLLLWLQRDDARTRQSWQRRSESLALLDRRLIAAQRHYDYWPWAKTIVNFDQLADWVRQFDSARALQTT